MMFKKFLAAVMIGAGLVAGIAFATVTGTYTPTRVSTDGNTTEYSFSFAVPAQGDLVVQLVNSTNTSNVTNQTLTTNYTVTLSKSTPGGHIDFLSAPAAGQYVQLSRDIDITQPTDIPAGGLFREIQIENALDRNVLLLQQQQEQIDRAIKVPLLSNDTTDYTTIIENAAVAAAAYSASASANATAAAASAVIASTNATAAQGYATAASASATNSSSSAVLAAAYADEAYTNSLGNLTVASTAEAQGATNDVNYMSPAKTKVLVEYAGAVKIPIANGGTNATNATDARTNLGIGMTLPSGAVFFMASGSCPAGTTDVSATYANKYVKINATQLTSSGVVLTGASDGTTLTAAQSGLPAHTHTSPTYLISGGPNNYMGGIVSDSLQGTWTSAANTAANATDAHNHTISSATTLEPSSITMKCCQVD
jgi:hypothetical protein